MSTDVNRVHSSEPIFPGGVMEAPLEACVHELFEAQVKRTPNEVAVQHAGKSLTYRELDNRAKQMAGHLRSLGVGLDSRVAISAGRSLELPCAVLGILKAGAAYVPLDPRYPAERLAFMAADSGAHVLVAEREAASFPSDVFQRVLWIDSVAWNERGGDTPDPGDQHQPSDSLAYVIYTSGSTGKPKGVAMVHRALANLVQWQVRQSQGLPANARTIQFTSLSFDVSFQEIFSTLCSGGTLVMMPDELRYDSGGLLRYLDECGIHRLFLPFVALQQLAEASAELGILPKELREVITAGEQLQITPALRTFFQGAARTRLHNHYGPSETHVATALALPEDPATWPVLPSIGRPIDGAEIRLLDAGRTPAARGEAGEIYIGGVCLARGYLGRDDLTKERFIEIEDEDGKARRLYRTGDLGRLNGAGEIEFLGRLDDQIKIRGFRVEPGEVETVLTGHAGVRECVVTAQGDGGAKRLVAYVVPSSSDAPNSEHLRSFAREHLADHLVPAEFVLIKELPLTPSGKVNRRGLPPPGSAATERASGLPSPPRTPMEEMVTNIWKQVLGRTEVGVQDNFFETGGTSLMVAQVLRRLEATLMRSIPITLLFQHPTIEQLARQLGEADPSPQAAAAAAVLDRAARQREAAQRRRPPRP